MVEVVERCRELIDDGFGPALKARIGGACLFDFASSITRPEPRPSAQSGNCCQQTVGQKLHTLTRDALGQLLHLVQELFAQGQPYEHVLERLMPA